MYESERGWGSKVDGYCGPFDTAQEAAEWSVRYNKKYNDADEVPDYYISALDPVRFNGQKCEYRKDL